jgi:hypothetical protein
MVKMIDEAELERLAAEADTDEKAEALAKRLEDEYGTPTIMAYQTVEIYRADAEGREPILM